MSLEKKINLEKDEKIIYLFYPSWWSQFFLIFLALFFILVPSYFSFFLFDQGTFGMLAFGLSIFIGLLLISKIFITRLKNFSVLTDQRIVNFKSQGFFNEEMINVNIYEVQNILLSKKGFLANLLNLGNLSLENNQRQELLFLSRISHPENAFHTINKIKNNFWLKEKDLNVDEIIDLFINNISLMATKDLLEIKDYLADILSGREDK